MTPSQAPTLPLFSLPSARLLVDAEFLVEQLMAESDALAGAPSGANVLAAPLAMAGGYGSNRRQMTFAHIRLSGLMRTQTAVYVADALTEALADTSVDGILLEVTTGGGEVTAAQMIRNVIKDKNKPVVVYAHLAASGGMMATMDADEIVAAGRTARVGSIGAMMSLPKYMRKFYGDIIEDVYADTSPDKNAAFREWLKTGNTDAFRADINALDAIFMAEMSAARPITKKLADSTLAGGVWLADEAKLRGLVDSIGTLNYAITRLASYAASTPSV